MGGEGYIVWPKAADGRLHILQQLKSGLSFEGSDSSGASDAHHLYYILNIRLTKYSYTFYIFVTAIFHPCPCKGRGLQRHERLPSASHSLGQGCFRGLRA